MWDGKTNSRNPFARSLAGIALARLIYRHNKGFCAAPLSKATQKEKTILQTSPANLAYIENLYTEYLKDPGAVARDWQMYFDQLNGHGSRAESSLDLDAPGSTFKLQRS